MGILSPVQVWNLFTRAVMGHCTPMKCVEEIHPKLNMTTIINKVDKIVDCNFSSLLVTISSAKECLHIMSLWVGYRSRPPVFEFGHKTCSPRIEWGGIDDVLTLSLVLKKACVFLLSLMYLYHYYGNNMIGLITSLRGRWTQMTCIRNIYFKNACSNSLDIKHCKLNPWRSQTHIKLEIKKYYMPSVFRLGFRNGSEDTLLIHIFVGV